MNTQNEKLIALANRQMAALTDDEARRALERAEIDGYLRTDNAAAKRIYTLCCVGEGRPAVIADYDELSVTFVPSGNIDAEMKRRINEALLATTSRPLKERMLRMLLILLGGPHKFRAESLAEMDDIAAALVLTVNA